MVAEWLQTNWQWLRIIISFISLLVISVTLWFVLLTWVATLRESTRASISELGDVRINQPLKVRPTLYEFNYWRKNAILEMKYLRGNRTGIGKSGPVGRWKPTTPNNRYDREKILNIDSVSDVYPEGIHGLRIECGTRNSLELRRIADEAVKIISDS